MVPVQLDFFEETSDEIEKLEKRFNALEESTGKVRRGIYAKHGELAKKYMELHQRLEVIERNLCQS